MLMTVSAKPMTQSILLFQGAAGLASGSTCRLVLLTSQGESSRYSITCSRDNVQGKKKGRSLHISPSYPQGESSSGDWSRLVPIATAHVKTMAGKMGPRDGPGPINTCPLPPHPHPTPACCKGGWRGDKIRILVGKCGRRWIWRLAISFCFSHPSFILHSRGNTVNQKSIYVENTLAQNWTVTFREPRVQPYLYKNMPFPWYSKEPWISQVA